MISQFLWYTNTEQKILTSDTGETLDPVSISSESEI